MHITYLSIFPEIFESFRSTTLISRAVENKLIEFETINPRHFTNDKHRTIDDEIYGGGHGLLMKAQPLIDSVKHWITKHQLSEVKTKKKNKDTKNPSFQIILPGPSVRRFVQRDAHAWAEADFVLFICGRYEGIDARVLLRLEKNFPGSVHQVSLGEFITLGGELPAMTMSEAIIRLIPGVLHSPESRQHESYDVTQDMNNIEHPQYTRPEVVEKLRVPPILLSGHHKNIRQRKEDNSSQL